MTTLFAVAFFGALCISLVLVPLVRRLAIRRTILDSPAGHKSHLAPVPYLGGVAIVIAFSVAVIVGVLLAPEGLLGVGSLLPSPEALFDAVPSAFSELLLVLVLALTLSGIGLMDDLKGLRPAPRLAVEVAVACLLVLVGVRFETPLPAAIDVVITLVWVVGITNALNLLDNVDGLAAGVTGISSLAIFVIGVINEQQLVALLAIGLSGCTLGFLRSNFNPASIYMGDAGSLYLGFMLAYLTLKIRIDPSQPVQYFVPLVLLGIAVMDTSLVVLSRLRRGLSPFAGGQDHISHRFLRLGVSVRRGVTVILLGSAVLGALGIALMEMPPVAGWIVLGSIVVHGVAVTVLLTTKVAREPEDMRASRRVVPLRRQAS